MMTKDDLASGPHDGNGAQPFSEGNMARTTGTFADEIAAPHLGDPYSEVESLLDNITTDDPEVRNLMDCAEAMVGVLRNVLPNGLNPPLPAIPALIDRIRELEAENERLNELLKEGDLNLGPLP